MKGTIWGGVGPRMRIIIFGVYLEVPPCRDTITHTDIYIYI